MHLQTLFAFRVNARVHRDKNLSGVTEDLRQTFTGASGPGSSSASFLPAPFFVFSLINTLIRGSEAARERPERTQRV